MWLMKLERWCPGHLRYPAPKAHMRLEIVQMIIDTNLPASNKTRNKTGGFGNGMLESSPSNHIYILLRGKSHL